MSFSTRAVTPVAVTAPQRARRRTARLLRASRAESTMRSRRPRRIRAGRHAQPVLLAVLRDDAKAREVRSALRRRFGADYRVRVTTSPALAMAMLTRLRDEAKEVVLVLADFRAGGMDLLARAHALHPGARRGLLATYGDHETATPIHQAMALGALDLVVYWPWEAPEEALYPHVSEALGRWWRVHRRRFERVLVIGEQWDARSHELRDLGTRNGVPFGFYPVESDAGRRLLREHGVDGGRLPVAVVDGEVLVDPSTSEIADALGATTHPPTEMCDVAIIGAGPAGLAAAVYAASEGLRTVVIEPESLGGQAGASAMIRNYLGFPRGISGEEITTRAHEQALHFGATIVHTHAATALRAERDRRIVTLSNGSELRCRTVVLATGVSYRRLGIPALERLVGAGVFYGAVTAESRALAGEDVYVVGAGNSAGQAALHLAQYARRVSLVVRGEGLASTMSRYLIRQLEHAANVDILPRTRVVDGYGDYRLECLVLQDETGRREVPARALFVQIGGHPRTDWLDGTLARDAAGYLLTCRDLAPDYTPYLAEWPLERIPFPMETSMPGVFAIGDVRHNSVKRVASAVGDGAIAIYSVHAYLAGRPE